jgi:hypothetical protein
MNPFRHWCWIAKETALIKAGRAWAKVKAGATGCAAVFKAVGNGIKVIYLIVTLWPSLAQLPSPSEAPPASPGQFQRA